MLMPPSLPLSVPLCVTETFVVARDYTPRPGFAPSIQAPILDKIHGGCPDRICLCLRIALFACACASLFVCACGSLCACACACGSLSLPVLMLSLPVPIPAYLSLCLCLRISTFARACVCGSHGLMGVGPT
jgi:hypothetical protein